jgi:hypothetical protein
LSFSYLSGVITQTGTDTNLSGLNGLTGVTRTGYVTTGSQSYYIYDIGTNRLDIEGDLTINPEENMFISNAPTGLIPNMAVNVRSGATLTLGVKTTVGTANKYTTGTAFVLTEQGNLNSNGSLHIESGGTLQAFGAIIQNAGPTRVRAGATLTVEDLTLVSCRNANCQFRIEASSSSDVALISITENGMTLNGKTNADSCRLTTSGNVNPFDPDGFIFNFVRAQYQPAAAGYPPQVFLDFDNSKNVDSADFAYAGSGGTGGTQFNGNLVDFRNVARRLRYANANTKGGFCKTTRNVNFNLQDANGTGLNTISYYAVDVNNGSRINFNGFDSTADIVYSGQNAGPILSLTPVVEYMAGESATRYVDSRTNGDDTIQFQFISYVTNITSSSPVLIGLRDLNSVIVNADDSLISEANRTTVDAYNELDTPQKIYDAFKSELVGNYTGQNTTIVGRVGNQIDLDKTATSLIIDATAVSVRDLTGTTATVKASTYTGGAVTTASGTVTTRNGALLNGGTFDCDVNYESGASTTLTNVTVNGILDFNTAGTYTLDGCTINEVTNSSGGAVTLNLLNGSTVTTNTGPSITLQTPRTGTISGLIAGSRIQIYNVTTATELHNSVEAGTSYNYNYSEGTEATAGDIIRLRVTYCSGITAYKNYTSSTVASASGFTIVANQETDEVYANIAIDGSTITKFSADYTNDEVDLVVGTNWTGAEWYAWWVCNLFTESGIRDFFGAVEAQDDTNFLIHNDILSILFDNTTASNVYQSDNRRIYREDEAYPVKDPTTGGGGIDIVWKSRVFAVAVGSGSLTPAQEAILNSKASQTSVDALPSASDNADAVWSKSLP